MDISIVPLHLIPDVIELPKDVSLLYSTAERMKKLCLQENGVGLSAVQVGIPWSLFVIKYKENFRYFVDCKYSSLKKSKRIPSVEGCLSLRDKQGDFILYEVNRWNKIIVKGFELTEKEIIPFSQEIDEPLSIVFQHEIDHCFGILISQIGIKHEEDFI